jgi:hypothetical protein
MQQQASVKRSISQSWALDVSVIYIFLISFNVSVSAMVDAKVSMFFGALLNVRSSTYVRGSMHRQWILILIKLLFETLFQNLQAIYARLRLSVLTHQLTVNYDEINSSEVGCHCHIHLAASSKQCCKNYDQRTAGKVDRRWLNSWRLLKGGNTQYDTLTVVIQRATLCFICHSIMRSTITCEKAEEAYEVRTFTMD